MSNRAFHSVISTCFCITKHNSAFISRTSRISTRRNFTRQVSHLKEDRHETENEKPSTNNDAAALSRFLPSSEFLRLNIRNQAQKDKFTSLVSEIQLFESTFGAASLTTLTDSMWLSYYSLPTPSERCDYLLELRASQFNANSDEKVTSTSDSQKTISIGNQGLHDAGEMSQTPDFHQLLDIRGQAFRKHLDDLYGSRLLSAERCDNPLPQLIIDCRFLRDYSVHTQSMFTKEIQSLHEGNWSSRNPFKIILANFLANSQLSDMVKRNWQFRFGPNADPSFQPHLFAPTITSQGIRRVSRSDENSDSVLYISSRSTRILPDTPPPNIRSIILCTSRDIHPTTSSLTAAISDNINTYRLPLEKYARTRRVLSLRDAASVLRGYFMGEDIGTAIRRTAESMDLTKKQKDAEEIMAIEKFKQAFEAISMARLATKEKKPWIVRTPNRNMADTQAGEEQTFSGRMRIGGSQEVDRKKIVDSQEIPMKRVRVHRYTREERNARRAEERRVNAQ